MKYNKLSFKFDDGRKFDASLKKSHYYQEEYYALCRNPLRQPDKSLHEFVVNRYMDDYLFDEFEIINETKLLPIKT